MQEFRQTGNGTTTRAPWPSGQARRADQTSDHRLGHRIETARTRCRSHTGNGLLDPTSPGQSYRVLRFISTQHAERLKAVRSNGECAHKLIDRRRRPASRSHHCRHCSRKARQLQRHLHRGQLQLHWERRLRLRAATGSSFKDVSLDARA